MLYVVTAFLFLLNMIIQSSDSDRIYSLVVAKDLLFPEEQP